MSQFQYLKCLSAPRSSQTISFYELLGIISHNPKKKTIERLYSLTKDTEEYDIIKASLPCIKPHGTFDAYCSSDNFQQASGYIYFDVDDTSITKEKLLNDYGHLISVVGHSVGGKCLFFMVKLDKPDVITKDNFIDVQNTIQSMFFANLPIDNNGKGLNRSFIIPYDKNLYNNPDIVIKVDSIPFNESSRLGITSGTKVKKRDGEHTTYDTSFNIEFMNINEVLPHIKWKTEIEIDEWDSNYVLCEHDAIKLFVPKLIPKGRKHKCYNRMVNAIVYNNPSVEFIHVISFVNYVNQRFTSKPMKMREMIFTVRMEYNRVRETGEFRGLKKKYVITNPSLSRRQRQKEGAKGWGEFRRNKSLDLLNETVEQLHNEGIRLTQKVVAQRLNGKISLATVKRNWNMLKRKQHADREEVELLIL